MGKLMKRWPRKTALFYLVISGLFLCGKAELHCTGSEQGPSHESLLNVFEKKSFRPTLNYSRPTSVNISFTLYAVLGVNEKSQILTTFLWLRLALWIEKYARKNIMKMSLINMSQGKYESCIKKLQFMPKEKKTIQEFSVRNGKCCPLYLPENGIDSLKISCYMRSFTRGFWYHEFLTWIPEKCGSVEKISLPVENIWSPDIIVYEFIDEDKFQRTPFVYVNHTGRVRYDRMMRVVSSCNLGIFNFPFDVQNCSLTFGSYLHTVKDVRVGLALPVEQIMANSLNYLETSGEWELLRIEGFPDILKFGADEWDIITFWVVIRRRSVLYVVNLLIPSAFLMLIDIISFYLPPHSTDRASFKMTLLLGYTVFLLIMNDLLPSTANGTPLIGIYFSVCLALLVLSLLETVIITHVLHRGALQSGSVPTWVKRLVLGYIAQLVCYRVIITSPSSVPANNHDLPTVSESDAHKSPSFSTDQKKINNIDHKVPELLPPDALSPGPERQLALISRNLQTVTEMMESKNHLHEQEEEWVQIGYVLDSLLYRLYLIFIGAYATIIISVWCIWYNM